SATAPLRSSPRYATSSRPYHSAKSASCSPSCGGPTAHARWRTYSWYSWDGTQGSRVHARGRWGVSARRTAGLSAHRRWEGCGERPTCRLRVRGGRKWVSILLLHELIRQYSRGWGGGDL